MFPRNAPSNLILLPTNLLTLTHNPVSVKPTATLGLSLLPLDLAASQLTLIDICCCLHLPEQFLPFFWYFLLVLHHDFISHFGWPNGCFLPLEIDLFVLLWVLTQLRIVQRIILRIRLIRFVSHAISQVKGDSFEPLPTLLYSDGECLFSG